jgi:integrase
MIIEEALTYFGRFLRIQSSKGLALMPNDPPQRLPSVSPRMKKRAKTIRKSGKILMKELPAGGAYNYPYLVTGPSYLDPSGNKRRWRRFFHSKAEAVAYLDMRAVAVANSGVSAREMKGDDIHAANEALKALQSMSAKATFSDLIALGLETLRRRQSSQRIGSAFEDYFQERFRQAASGILKRNTVSIQRRFCMQFMAFVGTDRILSEIRADEIRSYISTVEGAIKTQWHHYVAIRMFFKHCESLELIEKSPMRGVAAPRVPNPAPQVFSSDEVSSFLGAVLEHAPQQLGYYALSFFCGIRREEILRMNWDNVDLTDGYAYLSPKITKTGIGRVVKLADCARRWLEICQKNGKILPGGKKALFLKKSLLMQKSGLKRWIRNGARHSFVSYHCALRDNIYETATQAGHDVKMLSRHYRAIVSRAEAVKFWGIYPPDILTNIVPVTSIFPLLDSTEAANETKGGRPFAEHRASS